MEFGRIKKKGEGMARFIEYEDMLKNSCGILDILNEEDIYY